MMQLRQTFTILIILATFSAPTLGIERFPPPDFESGHHLPLTTTPAARHALYQVLDVVVLLAALSLASYLTLKKRNRRWIFCLMIFSLVYFGFWRKGCVCAIGAIQNVTLSLFDHNYALPITALIFFLLPLIFTLFFGRGFCAGVCPLGAIQDVVLVHPIKVPLPLQHALGLLAYIYLGAAILFAATDSAFIICEYDPFVSFFRLSGSFNMLILGSCILIIGLFVGRPYCRFLCPYGVLLRWASRLSKWKVTITPEECIKCGLCEDSCPFGAIEKPTPQPATIVKKPDKIRLGWLMLLLVVLIFVGGFLVSHISVPLSRMHVTVRLAERVSLEQSGVVTDTIDASDAFRATGEPIENLYSEALIIRGKFVTGGWLLGAFLGLVTGAKLIRLSVFRTREDYTANRADCLACGRCFAYCPVGKGGRRVEE